MEISCYFREIEIVICMEIILIEAFKLQFTSYIALNLEVSGYLPKSNCWDINLQNWLRKSISISLRDFFILLLLIFNVFSWKWSKFLQDFEFFLVRVKTISCSNTRVILSIRFSNLVTDFFFFLAYNSSLDREQNWFCHFHPQVAI